MGKSIAFTVTTDLTQDQRMQRVAGSLARAGYRVTLVGRHLPASLPLVPQPYRQHRLKCLFQKGPLFYLEYNLRLLLWFVLHPFDVYGPVDADTALAGLFTAWWRRKPLVYDAHELFQELPEVVHRPWVKKTWAWVERLAFSRATLCYTVSASLVSYFKQQYGREVGLVRNMPLSQSKPLSSPATPPYFIYQGALNVGRGLECAIQAMQQVPAQLLLCGDGPRRESLQRQVQELGLEEKVIFLGNVAPTDLVSLTAKATGGVMLLENQGLNYYYSLANKFFDYVQAGIPQVCVPFPEYERFNAQYEVALMVPLQVHQIQEALLALLQHQPTSARLRQNCLRARQEWCWEQEAQHLLKIYEQL